MKTKLKNEIIPAINYHLWEPCNMRCKFCFATFQDAKVFLPKGHLPKEDSKKIIQEIAKIGFKKITFAGGEPTLCPWISELIKDAKEQGLTTMLVTNGSKLDDKFLSLHVDNLDWIILSVDSIKEDVNLISGRAIAGRKSLTEENYKKTIENIKKYSFKLKINTVVHQKNYQESMVDFIEFANPDRWKVFQILPMLGENDQFIDEFRISDVQFQNFLNHHNFFKNKGIMVSESNDEMKDSYVMIDPSGRFFTNKKGFQEYSDAILSVGILDAYHQMDYNYNKFLKRGGLYEWDS